MIVNIYDMIVNIYNMIAKQNININISAKYKYDS